LNIEKFRADREADMVAARAEKEVAAAKAQEKKKKCRPAQRRVKRSRRMKQVMVETAARPVCPKRRVTRGPRLFKGRPSAFVFI
jgi:hypothetical protein